MPVFPPMSARSSSSLDPAASTDSQLPAELECGADRLPSCGPLRCEGQRTQPGRDALGPPPVLQRTSRSASPTSTPRPRGSRTKTLRVIAADPNHLGAEIGFLGVLHTWGQNLLHHPHIHFWFRAAGSRRTVKAGSPVGRGSSCRSRCCRECSAGCSCATWRKHSAPAS